MSIEDEIKRLNDRKYVAMVGTKDRYYSYWEETRHKLVMLEEKYKTDTNILASAVMILVVGLVFMTFLF